MKVVPLTLRQANELVARLHRHHKPVVGHRFSLGCRIGDQLVGAAIVGRPIARATEQYSIAEVTRLVTDGTKNACSFLYSAAARVAREMGFERIQTFVLATESGITLRASGWQIDHVTATSEGWHSRQGRRTDQPSIQKIRWSKQLCVNDSPPSPEKMSVGIST